MKHLISFNESHKSEKYFIGHEGGRGEYYTTMRSYIERAWDLNEEDDNGVTLGEYLDSAEINDRWVLSPDSLRCVPKFTEGISEKKLEAVIEENLMYLIDAGFKIEVIHDENHSICDYNITISKKGVIFSWEEIKYDFIPFIEILKKQYIISSISFRVRGNSPHFRHSKSLEVSVGTILKEGGLDKILQEKFQNGPIFQIEIEVR